MSNSQSWQAAIDEPLTQRLLRPVLKPGQIDPRMAKGMIARHQQFAARSPLLQQLRQRQESVMGSQVYELPIVYADPLPPLENVRAGQGTSEPANLSDRPSSNLSPGNPTVIQAKFDPSGSGAQEMPSVPLGIWDVNSAPVQGSQGFGKPTNQELGVQQAHQPRVRGSTSSPTTSQQGDVDLHQSLPATTSTATPPQVEHSLRDASPSESATVPVIQAKFDPFSSVAQEMPSVPPGLWGVNSVPVQGSQESGVRQAHQPRVRGSASSPTTSQQGNADLHQSLPATAFTADTPEVEHSLRDASPSESATVPVIQAKFDLSGNVAQGIPSLPFAAASRGESFGVEDASPAQVAAQTPMPIVQALMLEVPAVEHPPLRHITNQADSPQAKAANHLPLLTVAPVAPGAPATGEPKTPLADPLPVVQPLPPQASQVASLQSGSNTPFTLPLAQPAPPSRYAGETTSIPAALPELSQPAMPSVPVVNGQPLLSQSPSEPSPQQIDLNDLTDQVERRLKRKLVVERERRGWK